MILNNIKKKILATLIILGVVYSCGSPIKFTEEVYIPLTSISISSDPASITEDDKTLTLTVTYTPEKTTTGNSVKWTTSDASIATVSGGTVSALKNGDVIITATATQNSNIKDTYSVNVSGQTVDLLDLFKMVSVSEVGTTFRDNLVKAKLLDTSSSKNSILQSAKPYTLFVPLKSAWSTIDTSLIQDSDLNNIVKYHVIETAVLKDALAASYTTLYTGSDNMIYIAGGKVKNKSASPDVEATIKTGTQETAQSTFPNFSYDNNKIPATGTPRIVMHFIDKLLIPSSLYAKVTKKDNPTGVTISTPEAQRVINTRGGKLTLTATVAPATAWQGLIWTVSDSSIASIDKVTGEITAKKNGKVTVTATAEKGSAGTGKKYSATAEVTITNNFYGHTINGGMSETETTTKGASVDLMVNAETGENVVWTIDPASRDIVGLFNEGGAGTVASNGTKTVTGTAKVSVKAIADFNGTATLTAKPANGPTLTLTVKVNGQIPPSTISISGDKNAYVMGYTFTLTAKVNGSSGASSGVDQRVTWSTSSATLATIDANSGTVEMKATGAYDGSRTVTFTATSTADSTKTGTHIVTF